MILLHQFSREWSSDLTSCMGVFLPAVGEAWALATLGGELGPESGLLFDVSTGKQTASIT